MSGKTYKIVKVLVLIVVMCLIVVRCVNENKEVMFHEALSHTDDVYADIVTLVPQYTVGSGISSHIIVCKCRTTDGAIIWMKMTVEEYETLFGCNTNLENGMTADVETVKSLQMRVHGYASRADDVSYSLSQEIGSPLVLVYRSATKDDYIVINESEVAINLFTQDLPDMTESFVDIHSLDIVYTFYNELNDPLHKNPVSYVCQGVCSDGNTVWVYINAEEYSKIVARLFTEVTIGEENSIRIYGFTRLGDELVRDISKEIGVEKILQYCRIG